MMNQSQSFQDLSMNNSWSSFSNLSQSGSREAKRISLLTPTENPKGFSFSQEAKKDLESLENECFVFSVSGSPLVGKSTFLNLLLPYFGVEDPHEGICYKDLYPIGDGKKSTTQGIDMSYLSIKGRNYIFLDVEGGGDPRREGAGSWAYANFLQTAVGISHIHIYNYNKFPQENLLDAFDFINKVVKQNKIHADFTTKHVCLVRDHDLKSKEKLAQELEGLRFPVDQRLSKSGVDYSSHLLPSPPEHITRKEEETCLTSNDILCDNCQNHLFTEILRDLFNELNASLGKMTPFKSGLQVAQALEQFIEKNETGLPFYLDGMSQRSLDKFQKEKIRIQNGLLEVEQCQAQNSFSKEIQDIIEKNPELLSQELLKSFDKIVRNLERNISRMEYMTLELSKFLDQYIFKKRAYILDKDEKEAFWDVYVAPFDKFTRETIASLKEYDKVIEEIYNTISEIRAQVVADLEDYLKAASERRNRTIAVGIDLTSSTVLGFLGKEIAGRAIAVVVGFGGVVGAAITAYCFIQACRDLKAAVKKNQALDLKEIEGVKNVQDAEEKIKKMEEGLTRLVDNLDRVRSIIKEVCEESESGNEDLMKKISDAMDQKMVGNSLSKTEHKELLEKMNAAKSNPERFIECLSEEEAPGVEIEPGDGKYFIIMRN